jgi:S-adenosylmethionine decarboxylase
LKLSLVVKPNNLLHLDKKFWENIVKKCNATIISSIENEFIRAYLLSESSLFVSSDRFVMITCGETILVNSILEFLKNYPAKDIDLAIFQRKNEYQANLQKTSFLGDIKDLSKLIDGQAFRMGDLDGHHNYIFHTLKPFSPPNNDFTNELLMYHITGEAAKILRTPNNQIEEVRNLLNLKNLFPDFLFDDYIFSPYGYSLNAINEDRYITIHITPQEDNSYVSFETNIDLNNLSFNLLDTIVKTFNPKTFDHIGFNFSNVSFSKEYFTLKKSEINLTCGYTMSFNHYSKSNDILSSPVKIL